MSAAALKTLQKKVIDQINGFVVITVIFYLT